MLKARVIIVTAQKDLHVGLTAADDPARGGPMPGAGTKAAN